MGPPDSELKIGGSRWGSQVLYKAGRGALWARGKGGFETGTGATPVGHFFLRVVLEMKGRFKILNKRLEKILY